VPEKATCERLNKPVNGDFFRSRKRLEEVARFDYSLCTFRWRCHHRSPTKAQIRSVRGERRGRHVTNRENVSTMAAKRTPAPNCGEHQWPVTVGLVNVLKNQTAFVNTIEPAHWPSGGAIDDPALSEHNHGKAGWSSRR
jgi:hypothetical protein